MTSKQHQNIWPQPALAVVQPHAQLSHMKLGHLMVNSALACITSRSSKKLYCSRINQSFDNLYRFLQTVTCFWTCSKDQLILTWMDGSFLHSCVVHLAESVPIVCRNPAWHPVCRLQPVETIAGGLQGRCWCSPAQGSFQVVYGAWRGVMSYARRLCMADLVQG